jgi:hypothetical protein
MMSITYAEWHTVAFYMLSVIMLSVFMLSVVAPCGQDQEPTFKGASLG